MHSHSEVLGVWASTYEAPILWPPNADNRLTGTDPDAKKD